MLTQEMKDMIATQQCFVGTVNANGIPNVAPKRSTRVLSNHSIAFTEGTGGTTYANVKRGSTVAVAVVNRDILDGYRFIGTPIVHESGELYIQAEALATQMGFPKPKAVVEIFIEEIHSLKSGPMAGKRIV